jgi:hypothetical protein
MRKNAGRVQTEMKEKENLQKIDYAAECRSFIKLFIGGILITLIILVIFLLSSCQIGLYTHATHDPTVEEMRRSEQLSQEISENNKRRQHILNADRSHVCDYECENY